MNPSTTSFTAPYDGTHVTATLMPDRMTIVIERRFCTQEAYDAQVESLERQRNPPPPAITTTLMLKREGFPIEAKLYGGQKTAVIGDMNFGFLRFDVDGEQDFRALLAEIERGDIDYMAQTEARLDKFERQNFSFPGVRAIEGASGVK